MKNFTLLIFAILPFSLFAVTKTSVANGPWSSASTWSPSGAPGAGDDIVVNTGVTYNSNINFGMALFHITAAGSLVDTGTDTLTIGGDYFLNEGYMTTAVFVVGTVDSAVNRGSIAVTEIAQSGTFINHASGSICVSTRSMTSDDIMTAGSWSTGDLINGAVVVGNGGRFCVSGNFINSGSISGTLDICDASPGGLGDYNAGTIAGSVTNCQVGPCQTCTPNGIPEMYEVVSVNITPHPVSEVSTFEFVVPQLNAASVNELMITDITGRVVRVIPFVGTSVQLDRSGMDAGMYFYQLIHEESVVFAGKVTVQ